MRFEDKRTRARVRNMGSANDVMKKSNKSNCATEVINNISKAIMILICN